MREVCILALINRHAKCMFSTQHNTVICGMSGCTIFFDIISQMTQFFLKKVLKIKCVFTISLKLLSETFLILRIIQQDTIINEQRSSGKVTIIIIVTKHEFY